MRAPPGSLLPQVGWQSVGVAAPASRPQCLLGEPDATPVKALLQAATPASRTAWLGRGRMDCSALPLIRAVCRATQVTVSRSRHGVRRADCGGHRQQSPAPGCWDTRHGTWPAGQEALSSRVHPSQHLPGSLLVFSTPAPGFGHVCPPGSRRRQAYLRGPVEAPVPPAPGERALTCPCVLSPQDSVYIFREGALPPYRQMFYQLCDLNVQEYVRERPRSRHGAGTGSGLRNCRGDARAS